MIPEVARLQLGIGPLPHFNFSFLFGHTFPQSHSITQRRSGILAVYVLKVPGTSHLPATYFTVQPPILLYI